MEPYQRYFIVLTPRRQARCDFVGANLHKNIATRLNAISHQIPIKMALNH